MGEGRGSLKLSEGLQGWGTEQVRDLAKPVGDTPQRVLKAMNWGKAEKQQKLKKPKAFPLNPDPFVPVLVS